MAQIGHIPIYQKRCGIAKHKARVICPTGRTGRIVNVRHLFDSKSLYGASVTVFLLFKLINPFQLNTYFQKNEIW